jgi:hypothetical protein
MAADRVELLRSPIEARWRLQRGASLSIVTRAALPAPMLDLAVGSWHVAVNGAYGNGLPADRRFTVMSLVDASSTGGYADNQGLAHTKLFNRGGAPVGGGRLDVTALNGWSDWDAPGYLEKSAVTNGTVEETSAVNPTDGGELQHNLYWARYQRPGSSGRYPFEATAYGGSRTWERWRQDVLLGPTQPQVYQFDDRTQWGLRAEQSFSAAPGGRAVLATAGVTVQHDNASTRQANTENRVIPARTTTWTRDLTYTSVFVRRSGRWLRA